MTLGYSPDSANPKLSIYIMKISLIKAPHCILVGSLILLHRDMDQEGDFFDHEGREGMKCKNPLRDECDLIQQTSKAQL